jgi:hypothetical protein
MSQNQKNYIDIYIYNSPIWQPSLEYIFFPYLVNEIEISKG